MKTGAEMAPMPEPVEKFNPPPQENHKGVVMGVMTKDEFGNQIEELTLYLRNYFRKNYNTFLRYEKNPGLVIEDLIQDTLLKATKHLHTFNGKSSLKTWVARIFINNVNDFFRKRQFDPLEQLEPHPRNESPGENLERLIESARKSVSNPEELLLEKEQEELQNQLKEKLDRAIDMLPETEKRIFKLHLQNFTDKEISRQTGITYDTVKNYIFKAKRGIEKILGIKLPKKLRLKNKKLTKEVIS